MFGIPEWGLIVLVIVVLFGASAIPKIARSLGQAKSEFQKGIREENNTQNKTKNSNKNKESK